MDDGVSWVINIITLIILVTVNAIFTGFGVAIQSLNISDIEKEAQDGNKRLILIQKYIKSPSKFIKTTHIVSTFISMFIGAYEVMHLKNYIIDILNIQSNALQLVLLVFVYILCVIFIMVVGILVPRKVASKNAFKWSYKLVKTIKLFTTLLAPFIFIVTAISNIIIRICGIDPRDINDDVTEEEILSMVNEGHEQGVLLESEAEMINNIFELNDKDAKDIMIHRKNIVAVDCNMTLEEVLEFIIEQNYSRFPVLEEDIDNITGILHFKDVMIYHRMKKYDDVAIKDIEGLIREVSFIPETRGINILFKNMQSQKKHMVVVVDEYGQTAGIVAMEDILEEIVGNILDEYDDDFTLIKKQTDESFIMDGMAPLEEVEDVLEINIDNSENEYDTLNGLLISLLDKIPSDDEVFEIDFMNYTFKILSVENKIIKEVLVSKIQP